MSHEHTVTPFRLVYLFVVLAQLTTMLPAADAQDSPVFRVPALYGSGGRIAMSTAVADVNGDGKSDLIIANECDSTNCPSGIVSVSLSNGDGTFQPPVSYSSGGYETSMVVVGDVNGDGHPDLVLSNWGAIDSTNANGLVTVLLGKGDGTFQSAVGFGSGGTTPYAVAVADVTAMASWT
jgi:hypothetical protein